MTGLQEALANWFETNKRELPWRTLPTPYHVWLSEIILQQTRVSQGFEYYNRFVERWPELSHLADASEEEVLKMWQGLGYYSRARNLLQCARQVRQQHGGLFPADYKLLKGLKGVGPYTAAAIASIAFNLPHAVVDGNVYRVVARLFDIDTSINSTAGKKQFAQLADMLLDRDHPGRHNQAMMELGALQCVPKNPNCSDCPLKTQCLAFARGTVDERPVNTKKLQIKVRYFNYLVFKTDLNQTVLHKRDSNDIWKNLYDFPLIESKIPLSVDEILKQDAFLELTHGKENVVENVSRTFTHKLTHQTIIARFLQIKLLDGTPHIEGNNLFLTPEKDMGSYPVPRLIDLYLNN
ncbi:MAG: A/G-specific adenine glycosylase [Candidatus Limimorpha sp.]